MNKISTFLSKILLSIILVLIVLVITKSNTNLKTYIYDNVYNQNISFAYLNVLYTKYLGKLIPFNLDLNIKPVFKEKLKYTSSNKYLDGCVLKVDNNYLVPSIEGGIVVFIGEKDNYGKTIVIEQDNGIEIWYGGLDTISISLYDYIEKSSFLGTTVSNQLYLVFKKNGTVLNYEDYI